jgi:uncharacterized membrane protein (UPF0136 family)
MEPEYKRSDRNPASVKLAWTASALTLIGAISFSTSIGYHYDFSNVSEISGVISFLTFPTSFAFAVASYLKDKKNGLALCLVIVLGGFIFLILSLIIMLAIFPLHFM